VLAVEMKRQGTNDARAAEGMTKQAQGNAIERLGKNLIGFRSALQYERITPFICFGWGVDFAADSSILDRVITMNEFYPLNRTFVFKREDYAPVSMYFRAEEWDVDELYSIMREIAETSVRYYIF
jgi:type II restriction enzyme